MEIEELSRRIVQVHAQFDATVFLVGPQPHGGAVVSDRHVHDQRLTLQKGPVGSVRERRVDPARERVPRTAVHSLRPFPEKKEGPDVTQERPRGVRPCLAGAAVGQEVFELVERHVERRRVEDRQLHLPEAARPRRPRDRVDVHVVFDDAVGTHLELGLRIVGMPRARLDEARDAARLQKPAELAQHGVGIRHVMEGVEADDPVHAAVGQLDRPPVEGQELRLRPFADDRQPLVHLARDGERARRDVEQDHAAAELRQEPGEPAAARAELEDRHPRRQAQPLKHRRNARQQRRRIVGGIERLGEVMLPAGQRREIFLGGSIQVLEGRSRNQLPDIDRHVDRLLRASPRAHGLAAVLERRLYEDDRGGEALLMLERQIAGGDGSTEPRAKRIVERLEDIVQVVRMAGDERLVERFATQRVDDAVERRHAGADSARRFHERRRRRAVRNMEDANATRSDKTNQLTEKRKAIGRRHPLKDAVAVDEIELAAGARVINEELGRRLEFDVGGSLAIGLAPGGREHGGRPIDGGDSSRPPRERDGEAADAAAVLQRGHGREFRNEAQARRGAAATRRTPRRPRRTPAPDPASCSRAGTAAPSARRSTARARRTPPSAGRIRCSCHLRGSSKENRRDHISHPRYPRLMSRIHFRKRIVVVALAALTAACADRQTT